MVIAAMALWGAAAAIGLVSIPEALATEGDCASAGAVSDPSNNPGLVSDCAVLLAARDILTGTATLNWSADALITQWEGITVGGTPLRVTHLDLSRKGLTGEMPSELGSLPNLQWLDLSSNRLTGEIPNELRTLVGLQVLYLDRNQLTGEIPRGLGSLPNLQWLYLGSNRLTEEIPNELGNLSSLQSLYLGYNRLTGNIPTELGNLSNLKDLDLNRNQLTGEIPTELGNLSSLQWLYLDENQLTGEIPTELGSLSNLQRLYLNKNQLAGVLPQGLTGLTMLESFAFHSNLGICAPVNGAFQSWLQSIGDVSGSSCAPVDSLEDRAALVEFYSATDGKKWRTKTNWLSDRPVREWHGVTNDADGRVTGLYLSRNQLTGEIPTELGNLSNLQTLNLSLNQLTGEIPTELGNLSNLQTLNLSLNQLTGEVPTELGGLSNLEVLHLSRNQLMGEIPTELGSLLSLEQLFLNRNRLTGEIPPELGNLSNLRVLLLSGNRLTGCIPNELRDLPGNDFHSLGLPFCGDEPTVIESSPDRDALVALYHATDGENWRYTTNWLSTWPIGEWHGVTTDVDGLLTGLHLSRNQLRGEITTALGNLSRLVALDLSSNQLTGEIPSNLGQLANLQELGLGYNQLTGEMPTALGNLSSLQTLDLSGNQLTGPIPPELGNLSNLTDLRLGTNQLTGPIPPELGNLSNLKDLSLGANQLTGEIPSNLGQLANLQELGLRSNRLTGEMPTALGNLSSLQTLALSGNQLTGPIPRESGRLANLQELGLGANQLTGPIPPELGNLSNLKDLSLGTNQLTGPIPPELGNLSNLKDLNLGENQLTGPIPPELGNLSNLQRLWLYKNQLTGEIPPEFWRLSNLKLLWLTDNQLMGKIPPELINLSSLQALWLRKSGLTGCIPEVLIEFVSQLTNTDVGHPPICTGFEVVHTADNGPQIHKDKVFVLPTTKSLTTGNLYHRDYTARFFEYFHDEFDFLVIVRNLDGIRSSPVNETSYFAFAMNDVEGIGQRIYSDGDSYGSGGALQGVISHPYMNSISSGPSLHELMHRWANNILPLGYGAHWGFSSANGQLGGFDIAELVDHGDNTYSAGIIAPYGIAANWKPYSPIELYVAGFIPPEEVPDLWVAEDGEYLARNGGCVRASDGYCMFTATDIRTYTIEDIIAEHGERIPDSSQSQREFRAAVILLIDDDNPLIQWQLDKVSGDIAAFSYAGDDDNDDTYNFYEATGGRATITMDGLSQFLKAQLLPGVPTDLTAMGNELPGIDLSWRAPASDGGSAITAYDMRYIETSADGTLDSNWTVEEDVWTAGSDDLEYTLIGLTPDTQHNVQVRAVNAVGDGPWSATATGTTLSASVCVAGGAVTDAANTGLVSDCEALLEGRDTLAGSASLNWSQDTPISVWEGVTLGATPRRVTGLALGDSELSGSIPTELGNLPNLRVLDLAQNELTGPIPAELGSLYSIVELYLYDNQLTGSIPTELGNLSNLGELALHDNQLTGEIPTGLGSLTNLTHLLLNNNQLTGAISTELGNLTNLKVLKLSHNELTGDIPAELAQLTNLTELELAGNELTGCIPGGLRDAAVNDFGDLGLPFCMLTEDELLARYDANDNGMIDRNEAIAAIADYFAGLISRDEAITVISLYFASSG